MKAIAMRKPGHLDTLGLVELPEPEPKSGEVRVHVKAAAVNPADLATVRGKPERWFLHASTSPLVPGYDFSGVADVVGSNVADFEVGDSVFGHLQYSPRTRQGTLAEHLVVRADAIAKKPETVPHETAAAAATVGLTALQALRDKARVARGERVLILGASGGVGSLAVGIAQRLGAQVTAVCSSYAVDRVRDLGANAVIDRQTTDALDHPEPFDVVFDTTGKYSFTKCRTILKPSGRFVTTLPSGDLLLGKAMSLFSTQRSELVSVRARRRDLEVLAQWLQRGLAVPIGERYEVRDTRAALERLERGEVFGKVAVAVPEGSGFAS